MKQNVFTNLKGSCDLFLNKICHGVFCSIKPFNLSFYFLDFRAKFVVLVQFYLSPYGLACNNFRAF